MSTFTREARRLDREVAERGEWIEKILRIEPEKQKRLYRHLDVEAKAAPGMTEAAETIMAPVDGATLRVLRSRPGAHGMAPASGSTRPVVFVPGWGAVPGEFEDLYEYLHGEVELYYIETREKPSSVPAGRRPDMSVEQSARDIAAAIRYLGLDVTDYVLLGSCWGASIILEALHQGCVAAPTVLAVDPMQRLWFPRPLLRFFFFWTPDFLVRLLKPLIVWLRLRGMEEPRQRERAEQFIREADIGKWRRAAVAARNFQLAGRLESIEQEVFVLTCSGDYIHDQRYYPVLTRRLPRGRFLSLQVDEAHRERMIGLAVREFARTPPEQGVPESFREYLKLAGDNGVT
ncbi:MAG: alpha/beta fold hydrolase [Spirochaetaceae bacterium]